MTHHVSPLLKGCCKTSLLQWLKILISILEIPVLSFEIRNIILPLAKNIIFYSARQNPCRI